MNPLIKFFHQLIQPHCPDCISQLEMEMEEKKYCSSCATLQMELATANKRIDDLLTKLTDKPFIAEVTAPAQPQQVIQTRHLPWSVQRQRLEAQSKLRAQELRQNNVAQERAAKPDSDNNVSTTDKLEQELGINTNASNS
jgi:hypothetical protein